MRGNVQHERKNAQVFCGSTQKTRTDHEKLKFAMSKGSGFSGTIPVRLQQKPGFSGFSSKNPTRRERRLQEKHGRRSPQNVRPCCPRRQKNPIFSNPKTREKRRFPEKPQEMKQGKKIFRASFPHSHREKPRFSPVSWRFRVLTMGLSRAALTTQILPCGGGQAAHSPNRGKHRATHKNYICGWAGLGQDKTG